MHNNSFKREAPFQCRGCGSDRWSGNWDPGRPHGAAERLKNKKIKEKQKLHLAVYLKETFPASLPTPLYVYYFVNG